MAVTDGRGAPEIGVLIFSYNLEKVVLVKPKGSDQEWQFPSRPKGTSNFPEMSQAASLAKQISGLTVSKQLSGEYVELLKIDDEGNEKPVHAFVAVDVAEQELTPGENSEIEEVSWQPFAELLYAPETITELNLPYQRFIDRLLFFVDRHPELRIEPNLDLKKLITWQKDKWVGQSPREFLKNWCESHGFAEACFNVIEQRTYSSVARVAFCGVCVLPHLGVQVAAERSFYGIDQAVENAALMAILYLDGAVPDGSTRLCHVIPVGYQIPLKGTFLGTGKRAAQTITPGQNRGGESGGRGRGGNRGFGGGGRGNPRPQKRPRTDTNTVNEENHDKNAIMMVKEFCDKAKWGQPTYKFEGSEDGGFHAIFSLPSAGIENLKGPKATTSKLAKNLVAEWAWVKLQQIQHTQNAENAENGGGDLEMQNQGQTEDNDVEPIEEDQVGE
eukprot:TRINITY_DN7596_c0_g5_i1.p2 TRINITY_DN7596_c0_g5~~TRINITY_DN7596_c0_g5_i1.p2  ORF type:complete len:476 (+),score=90.26 TRINITY_DN7596_c0_g5_i1:99-1430(+)